MACAHRARWNPCEVGTVDVQVALGPVFQRRRRVLPVGQLTSRAAKFGAVEPSSGVHSAAISSSVGGFSPSSISSGSSNSTGGNDACAQSKNAWSTLAPPSAVKIPPRLTSGISRAQIRSSCSKGTSSSARPSYTIRGRPPRRRILGPGKTIWHCSDRQKHVFRRHYPKQIAQYSQNSCKSYSVNMGLWCYTQRR